MQLNRAAPGDLGGAFSIPNKIKTLAKIAHTQFYLSIQNQSEGRLRIMMDDKHHRSTKIRVGHLRHGH